MYFIPIVDEEIKPLIGEVTYRWEMTSLYDSKAIECHCNTRGTAPFSVS